MIQPSGAQSKIDEKQKFVSWTGFEFFMITSSDTGPALRHIEFDGDSVINSASKKHTSHTQAGIQSKVVRTSSTPAF